MLLSYNYTFLSEPPLSLTNSMWHNVESKHKVYNFLDEIEMLEMVHGILVKERLGEATSS